MSATWLNITDENGTLLERIDLREWDLTNPAAQAALAAEIRTAQ